MSLNPKLFNTIKSFYVNGDYKKKLGQKYEGNDYNNWKLSIKDQLIGGRKLYNDTAGFTPSYTAFTFFEEKQNTDFFKSFYSFFIRKSRVGDYVTCYGIIRTTLDYGGDRVRYPDMFVASPIGPYITFFKEGWELLQTIYPESTYIGYSLYNYKVDDFTLPGEKFSTVYDLIFGQYGQNPKMYTGDRYYDPSMI